MRARKKLVWATLFFFIAILVCVGIYRSSSGIGFLQIDRASVVSVGASDAKIQMVVFQDFSCSACRRFLEEVFPKVRSSYINLGVVHFSLVPVAMRESSRLAANAVLEVQAQSPEQVLPFIEELLRIFDKRSPSAIDLIHLATKLEKIQVVELALALQTGKYNAGLRENFELAKKIMGKKIKTPALFINGEMLRHSSFEDIAFRIEALEGAIH